MTRRLLIVLFLSVFLVGCDDIVEDVIYVVSDEILNILDSDDAEETSTVSELQKSDTYVPLDDLTDLEVHYIDAGQADATLFRFVANDETYHVLYDVGDWHANDLIHYLEAYNVDTLDLVIASHPHSDHIGQLRQVIEIFSVSEVWASGNTNNSRTFENAAKAILDSEANYHEPRAGETYDIGPLTIDVLHPKKLTGGLNEDSISVLFTYGEMKFIFTGDAYQEQELAMIDRVDDISATILRVGHHGSSTSSHKDFVRAVDPDIAIYSAGQDNTYGHPHRETVALMKEENIPLYGTAEDGTIIITTDGKDYSIQTKEDGTLSPENTIE